MRVRRQLLVTGANPGSGSATTDAGRVATFTYTGTTIDTVEVRAERAGSGDGRVYVITFTGDDGRGGTCTGTVTVSVPHDQSGNPAVDSGARHDSFGS